jgi:Transposase DDE domain
VELCCLFDLISRAPLRFVYGRASTSEHKLIPKLISYLKKGDLLLLDSGFYYCATLKKVMARTAHFIIPAREDMRPKVVRHLAESDYLCEIKDSRDKTTITVRVVFVHRDGFRRRRLVTSLLDPIMFPASELARLYHMRWDIETFYRDFKHALRATSWHCQTPETFHQEILVHMIVCCLIRIAMIEGSGQSKLSVGQISFARTLTETRLLFKKLSAAAEVRPWAIIWTIYVQCCAQYRVNNKPNRRFSRDQQEYRRKSRGLEKRRRGRKRKYQEASPLIQPETRKNAKEQEFLLS